jgi:hypothetical protein
MSIRSYWLSEIHPPLKRGLPVKRGVVGEGVGFAVELVHHRPFSVGN